MKPRLQRLLQKIKSRQLPHSQRSRSSDIRSDPIPHFCESFLLGHSNCSIEKTCVVSSLLRREKAIVLESDHDEIGGVGCETSNCTTHKRNRCLQIQRWILTAQFLFHFVHENSIETHSYRCIDRLSVQPTTIILRKI